MAVDRGIAILKVLMLCGISVAASAGSIQTVMVTGQEGKDAILEWTLEKPDGDFHDPTVKWERKNKGEWIVVAAFSESVSNLHPRYNINSEHSLVIHNVTISDEDLYKCVVAYKRKNPQESDGPYETLVQRVNLTVLSPINDLLLYSTNDDLLVCNATNGKPPASIHWIVNGVVITKSTREFSVYSYLETTSYGRSDSISELTFLKFSNEHIPIVTCVAQQENLAERYVWMPSTDPLQPGQAGSSDKAPPNTTVNSPTVAHDSTTPRQGYISVHGGAMNWMLVVVVMFIVMCILVVSFTIIVCWMRHKPNSTVIIQNDIENQSCLNSNGIGESSGSDAQQNNNNTTNREPSFSLLTEFTGNGFTNTLVNNSLNNSFSRDVPDLVEPHAGIQATSRSRDSGYDEADGLTKLLGSPPDDTVSTVSSSSASTASSEASMSDRPLSPGYVCERDAFEIPRDDIIFDKREKLGAGFFGEVFKGLVKLPGKVETSIVAIKTLKECSSSDHYEALLRELQIMKTLNIHPNVVTLLGCCTRPRDAPIYVIVEFVPRGTLRQYLQKNRPTSMNSRTDIIPSNRTLTNKDLIKFAYQVAKGMKFLHQHKCIHRDLAARNVLVTLDANCKISDFGLARNITETLEYVKNSSGPLPLRWEAPESISQRVYNLKTDVWSYGILLWEIVTFGGRPYPHLESCDDVRKEILQGRTMQRPKHCHKKLYKVMKTCWAKDPEKRPSFSSIVAQLEPMRSTDEEYVYTSQYDVQSYMN